MIDTVRFRVTHPRIQIGSAIHEAIGPVQNGVITAEGSDGTLIPVRGGKLFSDEIAFINASRYGFFVTTSLARNEAAPDGPNVFGPRSGEACLERIITHQKHLEAIGFEANLRDAGLSRLDLYNDLVLSAPYGDYLAGLQRIDFQRLSPADLKRSKPFGDEIPRGSKRPLPEHTYGRTTKRRAYVAYSKTAHLQSKTNHRDYVQRATEESAGRDIMRFECRFLEAEAVRSGWKVKRGIDLAERWDILEDRYRHYARKQFGTSKDAPSPASPMPSVLNSIVEQHGGGKMSILLHLATERLQSMQLVGGSCDIEHLRAVWTDAGLRKRDIDAVLDSMLRFVGAGTAGTVESSLAELQDKLMMTSYRWPAPRG